MIESMLAAAQPDGLLTPTTPRTLDHTPQAAIIGAGLMGRWHAHAIRRAGGNIAAVVDSDIDRARALARGTIAATNTDGILKDALDGGAIDVVHVCTPSETHFKFVRQAIELGAHVLVEKPLTDSVSDTRSLLQLAAGQGLFLCPVHQFPFQKGVERAAAAIRDLGQVQDICFTTCSAGGSGAGPDELSAIVDDILPHPLSVLRRLWPETALNAGDWRAFRSMPGNLHVAGPHGRAQMTIIISMHARPTCCELVIRCSKGTLLVDFFHGFAILEPGGVSRTRKILRPFHRAGALYLTSSANLIRRIVAQEPAYPGLVSLVQHFYAAIAGREALPISPTDTVAVAEARAMVLAKVV